MRKLCYILFFVSISLCCLAQEYKAKITYDSTAFAIKADSAKQIALKSNYNRYGFDQINIIVENNNCIWKVKLFEVKSKRHRRTYRTVYHYYFIDPHSGKIISTSCEKVNRLTK